MNEQDFKTWLRERTDATPVPDALLPEHISEQLHTTPHQKKWYQHPGLNIAATFLLIGIISSSIWAVNYVNNHLFSTNESFVKTDTAMEDSQSKESIINEEDTTYQKNAIVASSDTFESKTAIQTPENYRQLYKIMDGLQVNYLDKLYGETVQDIGTGEAKQENSMIETDDIASGESTSKNENIDYYDTNSQVTQVSEADIVKTDGTYIYSCYYQGDYSLNAVAIAKAENGTLTACSTISPEDIENEINCTNFYIAEMYVTNQKLVLLCSGSTTIQDFASYDYAYNQNTYILTYDVSKPEKPVLLSSLMQEGSYNTSRCTDGYVYTFSNMASNVPEHYRSYDRYVPHIEGSRLDCEDIFLPKCPDSAYYQIMTGMSLEKPDDFISSKAVLSASGTYYVSTDNIYYAQQSWDQDCTKTEILKFSYYQGNIQPEGSITVSGYLLNQFSMDEYNNYLRVVATVNSTKQTNALYVIDSDMSLVGIIDQLAPDERIYSVRFMGDTGYFVTYRETDPLFSVDLSDPTNPIIMDALKIPGFSNYLHFYSNDLLFGVGEEINPSTGEFIGLKLSMFDISDPYNITELDKTVLPDVYYSAAQYNHKALLIDPERNLIGFYAECYNDTKYEYGENYMIYSYQPGKGFQKEFTCNLTEDEILSEGSEYYGESFYNTRGLYIDNYLYLVYGNRFCSYDLDTFEKKEGLIVRGDEQHIHATY